MHDAHDLDPHDLDARRLSSLAGLARVEVYDELASTSDHLLARACDPDCPTPLVVAARRQTAGRGRGANRWWSMPGALTFSLLAEAGQLDLDRQRWPRISLATAVAVCTAVEEFVPGARCGVKWPNDVVADGRKLAGILVEVPAAAPRPRLVVGVGVNVNNTWADAPRELGETGVAICDLAADRFDLNDVLTRLIDALATRLRQLSEGDPRLADAWQSRDILRGRRVQIVDGARTLEGLSRGIDAEGALLLETSEGPQRLHGGTVAGVA